MPPALSRKGCFLEGGGGGGGGAGAGGRHRPPPLKLPPPPSALYQDKFFCKRRHGPPSLQACSDPSARDMPRRCEALVMRTRPEVPSSGMVFRCKSGKTKAFCATARCDIPACLRIPYRPTVTARPLPSPRPFFSRSPNQPIGFLPLCGNAPVPPFAHEGCRRRPQAPAQKKRNFLDLWQTIAQDLSRLFAVPGGCPSCLGSRKDWPEPLSRFRRPVPAPSLLPAAFRKALCAA